MHAQKIVLSAPDTVLSSEPVPVPPPTVAVTDPSGSSVLSEKPSAEWQQMAC